MTNTKNMTKYDKYDRVAALHNGGVLCENFKKFRKIWTYFFTYSLSTHFKEQPLKLLRSSDQPFSLN